MLSAVEALLEQAWRPQRTLVLAFGFDEETGGVRGAAEIAKCKLYFSNDLIVTKTNKTGDAYELD